MKVAYVYEYDASNPAVQSTRPYSILQELKRRFTVAEYFPVPNFSRRLLAPRKIAYAAVGKDHHLEREWLALKEYAWRVEAFLQRERPDVVFAPSQLVVTYLNTPAKIIYCNDAPFSGLANYYPHFCNLSEAYLALGYRQEYHSHKNADRIVYPSSWARELAIRLHDADPRKCMEQPFGANLPYIPTWEEVKEARDSREKQQRTLLDDDLLRLGAQGRAVRFGRCAGAQLSWHSGETGRNRGGSTRSLRRSGTWLYQQVDAGRIPKIQGSDACGRLFHHAVPRGSLRHVALGRLPPMACRWSAEPPEGSVLLFATVKPDCSFRSTRTQRLSQIGLWNLGRRKPIVV